jgi:hypothetical protein
MQGSVLQVETLAELLSITGLEQGDPVGSRSGGKLPCKAGIAPGRIMHEPFEAQPFMG